jgi:molybdopterin molybdotransferase
MPLEETERRGGIIDIYTPVAAGANVIPPGREAEEGDTVLAAGRVLRPADIAMLIGLDVPTVAVSRRPRVGVVSARNDVADASGAMIGALVERDGGIAANTVAAGGDGLAAMLGEADRDLLLVIGASGVGANDHAAAALAESGEVTARGVAINPGETTTLGCVNDMPVVILPGPPLAALFAYDMIAGRAVRRLVGRSGELPYGARRAVLERKVASGLGRLECCRVRVSDGRAEPIAVSDNRTLSTAVRADGFVLVPEHSEGCAPGSEVTVYMYDQRY